MAFVKIASVNDVKPGQGKAIVANGKEIALFNVGGKFFAISNECRHQGGPLGEGDLDGNIVTCPLHMWQYDVTTGQSLTMPGANVQHYAVKVEGNDVLVDA